MNALLKKKQPIKIRYRDRYGERIAEDLIIVYRDDNGEQQEDSIRDMAELDNELQVTEVRAEVDSGALHLFAFRKSKIIKGVVVSPVAYETLRLIYLPEDVTARKKDN